LADGDRNAGNSGARVSPSPYPRLVSNPCRFCGVTNRQITKEHVWPDWLRDYLPPVSELHDIERYSPGTKRQRLPQPFLRTTVRAFCDGCNSGWMADIEAAAKPIVDPMVVWPGDGFDADAQQIVANWVALKGLVAAVTSNLKQEIPNSHYRHVHNFQGAPPDTMRVWVSRRRNLADAPTGRLHIFDFHFMPVTNKFRQFPIPPDVELSGWALLRPRFPARLARSADVSEARVRGGRRIAANLAHRSDRSLAAAQVHRRPRRPAQGDQVPSDRPASGSCLRPVGPPSRRSPKRLPTRRIPRVRLFTVASRQSQGGHL
jgi:hypothetical protein